MMVEDIRRIAVVGAGLMGHGIAQDYALGGYEVALHSRTQASLDRALANIEANLERLVGLELVTPAQAAQVPARLRTSTAFEEAVRDADVVVESVFEDLALKRQVFKRLDDACPDRTILASNTSSLMPTRIAEATRRADRVIVTHYTNPPYLVPLVEVVRAEDTSDSTVATVSDLLTRVGKRPILVQKEVPGFVLNRLSIRAAQGGPLAGGAPGRHGPGRGRRHQLQHRPAVGGGRRIRGAGGRRMGPGAGHRVGPVSPPVIDRGARDPRREGGAR